MEKEKKVIPTVSDSNNMIKKDLLTEFKDLVKDLIIIVLIVVFIRTFLVMPFQISGQSMYDSYYDKEFILVDRFSYLDIPYIKTGKISRGDVIVFKPGVNPEKQYFIKRVIGLPGDKLKIELGKVYLFDNKSKKYIELNEGYLSDTNRNSTFVGSDSKAFEYTVPEDSYFVMGDNRNSSTDSRLCFSSCILPTRSNFINKKSVTGRVFIDLGYFDWIRISPNWGIGDFKFLHPNLGIDTSPKWLSSPNKYDYE